MRVGLILAGGRSRRFGPQDKLLADLDGRPLVAHAAAALAAVPLDRRWVVAGSEAVARAVQTTCPTCEVIEIDNQETGQSDTLRAGVAAAQQAGATRILIALGDMPFVGPSHLETVLHRCTENRAAASTDGVRPMPPACFPAEDIPALLHVTGDKGAAPLLRALPGEALVPLSPSMALDVDTVDALAIARSRRGDHS